MGRVGHPNLGLVAYGYLGLTSGKGGGGGPPTLVCFCFFFLGVTGGGGGGGGASTTTTTRVSSEKRLGLFGLNQRRDTHQG